MFCKNCGARIATNELYCHACGARQALDSPAGAHTNVKPDAKNGGLAFLCCIFPMVGLALYLVWKEIFPLKANSCGTGAIIGVVIGVGLPILFYIGMFLFAIFMATITAPMQFLFI